MKISFTAHFIYFTKMFDSFSQTLEKLLSKEKNDSGRVFVEALKGSVIP